MLHVICTTHTTYMYQVRFTQICSRENEELRKIHSYPLVKERVELMSKMQETRKRLQVESILLTGWDFLSLWEIQRDFMAF